MEKRLEFTLSASDKASQAFRQIASSAATVSSRIELAGKSLNFFLGASAKLPKLAIPKIPVTTATVAAPKIEGRAASGTPKAPLEGLGAWSLMGAAGLGPIVAGFLESTLGLLSEPIKTAVRNEEAFTRLRFDMFSPAALGGLESSAARLPSSVIERMSKDLEASSIKIANQLGLSGLEAAQGLSGMVSGGARGPDITRDMLTSTLAFSKAAQIPEFEAGRGLVNIAEMMRIPLTELRKVADQLVYAHQVSGTPLSELIGQIQATAAAAGAAKLSLGSLTGTMAALGQRGIHGEDATGFIRAYLKMIQGETFGARPHGPQQVDMAALGIHIIDPKTGRQVPLFDVVERFGKAVSQRHYSEIQTARVAENIFGMRNLTRILPLLDLSRRSALGERGARQEFLALKKMASEEVAPESVGLLGKFEGEEEKTTAHALARFRNTVTDSLAASRLSSGLGQITNLATEAFEGVKSSEITKRLPLTPGALLREVMAGLLVEGFKKPSHPPEPPASQPLVSPQAGPTTNHINVYVKTDADPAAIAKEVAEALERQKREDEARERRSIFDTYVLPRVGW